MNNLIPLVSYPKSGNTWMRFLLANVFKRDREESITFKNINNFTATSIFDNLDIIKQNVIENGPIFIKEHADFNNIDNYDFKKGIYIYRNGFDVLYSYWHFTDAQSPGLFSNIKQFSRCYWEYCGHWGYHVNSWIFHKNNKEIFPVCYEKLIENPVEVMVEVLNFLGYNIDENIIKKAVFESDKKNMKNLSGSDEFMKSKKKNFHFVRSGKINESKQNLPDFCKNYFLANNKNFEIMKNLNYISKGIKYKKSYFIFAKSIFDFILCKYKRYMYIIKSY